MSEGERIAREEGRSQRAGVSGVRKVGAASNGDSIRQPNGGRCCQKNCDLRQVKASRAHHPQGWQSTSWCDGGINRARRSKSGHPGRRCLHPGTV